MIDTPAPKGRVASMLIGFGLTTLAVLLMGQYIVISQLRDELRMNREQIEENEAYAIKARRIAEETEKRSQRRHDDAIKHQADLAKELHEWRAEFKRQNPEIVVPKVKGDK